MEKQAGQRISYPEIYNGITIENAGYGFGKAGRTSAS